MSDQHDRRSVRFGPVDPYCWLAVGSLLALAVVFAASNVLGVGIVLVVLAGLVALFDSWVNRPAVVVPVAHQDKVDPGRSRRTQLSQAMAATATARTTRLSRPRAARPQPS
ncbi:MAG TPA: hypothetical protein VHW44_31930 [Pseudonocardiaceae bacterium]|jgi:hypothetical protein|nr:hypothetical protein [Pseudonocardiaceae bacterium]